MLDAGDIIERGDVEKKTFIHLLTLLRINFNMSLACSVGLIPIDHNLEFKVMYNEITQRRSYIICRDVRKYIIKQSLSNS